jgi:LEA14-like dessication related protein
MKTKIKYVSLCILIIVIILGGISYFYRSQLKNHFIPKIEQVETIHIKVENDTCYISSKLRVTNKSFFKIGFDTIKYKVALENKIYLQNQTFIGKTIHGHTSDTVDFALKIPYKRILSDLKTERKNGDSASYSIDVSIQYSTFLGKAEMPINKSARLKIPQPPELEIIDIKYEKIHLKSIHATVKIKITNYNPVNLSIKQMSYTMEILKHGSLKGTNTEQIEIKPNGTTITNLPIEINPQNIVRTFFDVLTNKDVYDYTLTLNALIESTDPLKSSFSIDLIKKGKMELKK